MVFNPLIYIPLLPLLVTASRISHRTTCSNYVIISTRGTNEPQGPSEGFIGMINQTLTAVPGGIEYDTVYPAGDNTQDLGTEDILRYIHAGIAACPGQKYVLLGYSQGATATAAALNNITDTTGAAYKAVKAAVVIGNPGHVANQTANYDQNGGKATNQFNGVYSGRADIALISPVWYNSGKLRDICYVNDLVCVGLTPSALLALFIPHLLYGSTPSVQKQGSDFIIPLLK